MTDNERQQLKAKLIKGRFWGADDLGDPTIDKYAATTLRDRAIKKLVDGVYLTCTGYVGGSPTRKVEVVRGEFTYLLANADTYSEAICLAALELPEFLRQHPECAADQK
ncbi:MAG: hypothetical protein ACREAB_20020 [Blastocatellia bacterium]